MNDASSSLDGEVELDGVVGGGFVAVDEGLVQVQEDRLELGVTFGELELLGRVELDALAYFDGFD